MDTLKHSDLRKNRASRGFTLVEIAMVIAIVSFGFVSILGLLPTGLGLFRAAMDSSVGAQIAQKVVNDSEQTDFATLTDSGGNQVFCKPVRYFGEQGNELPSVAGAIYHVNTRVSILTAMPTTGGTSTANSNLAMVTIQVANNPGNGQLAVEDANSTRQQLWTGAFQSNPLAQGVVRIVTYCAHISRNK